MNRLADLILLEMERRSCSATYFSDVCGISKNGLNNILRRKTKDINVSTILKICENSELTLEKIFDIQEKPLKEIMSEFILTNGKEKFCINNVPSDKV